MMPFIQGEPSSVPSLYAAYSEVIANNFFKKGEIGFLTIDESFVEQGKPHRGQRAKTLRALHTEAGIAPGRTYRWGGPNPGWGRSPHGVTLERDVKVLLASNLDDSCAVWAAEHEDTSDDGDIGHVAHQYPYEDAFLLKAGQLCEIGILTPHESLPVTCSTNRQFLRIISSGVHGREPYFTENPLVPLPNSAASA